MSDRLIGALSGAPGSLGVGYATVTVPRVVQRSAGAVETPSCRPLSG